MSKDEYLRELENRLSGIDEKEREDALRYCEEYFNEAGEDNEAQAMADLGTPSKFAAQIKAEAAIRSSQKDETLKKPRSTMKTFITIFLGLCAMPIALPLLCVAVILVIVFMMVFLILAIAGFIVIIAMLFGAIPMIIGAFFIPFSANTLMRLGSGLMMMSFAIYTVVGMYYLIKVLFPWFMQSITKLYKRGKGVELHEEKV